MRARPSLLIWGLLLAVFTLTFVLAGRSPLLAWRQPVYIAASFAGILAMCLMLVQPLLMGGGLRLKTSHGTQGASLGRRKHLGGRFAARARPLAHQSA